MKRLILSAAVAVTLFATPALAADTATLITLTSIGFTYQRLPNMATCRAVKSRVVNHNAGSILFCVRDK